MPSLIRTSQPHSQDHELWKQCRWCFGGALAVLLPGEVDVCHLGAYPVWSASGISHRHTPCLNDDCCLCP